MQKTKKQVLIELRAFLMAYGTIVGSDIRWHRIENTDEIKVSGLVPTEMVAAFHALQQAIYLAPWLGVRGDLCVTILGEGEL